MRGPRYRFPDAVRTTTRAMAVQMVRDGEVASSPAELEAWIAASPEVRQRLEAGGYGTRFTAEDLFPLLAVAVERAGGPSTVPPPDAPPPFRAWIPLLVVGLLVVALVVIAVRMGWFR